MRSSVFVILSLLLGTVTSSSSSHSCDPSCLELSSIEVFRKEEGWYVGNYTLLGADGGFFTSTVFPYGYAQYRGFIHTELKGSCRQERSIFVYPPLATEDCTGPDFVAGEGQCGVNGNEKVFGGDQKAVDCDGNLVGIDNDDELSAFESTTTVTVGKDDTLLFQSRFKEDGALFQNSLTTIGPDGTRLQTTQAFNRGVGPARPRLLSYFREEKVSKEEWMKQLAETRAKFNILESDYCGFNAFNAPSNTTCEEHFTTPECPVKPRNRRQCVRNLRRFKRGCKYGFLEKCRCDRRY